MNVSLQTSPTRSATLTTAQLESVQRVWEIAGLPPTCGYAATFLAMAVASHPALAATLTSVDFDDAESVLNAVEELGWWRRHAFGATS